MSLYQQRAGWGRELRRRGPRGGRAGGCGARGEPGWAGGSPARGAGVRESVGRQELIPLITKAFVWRCQGHAAVFKESLAPRGPPWPGRLAAPSQGGCQRAPRPADACPFPDRALANVLLLRVVVIYILSVYINLSAAALAALLQSACLRGRRGDGPHRRPGGGRGDWAAEFLRPRTTTNASQGGAPPPGPGQAGRGDRAGGARGAGRGAGAGGPWREVKHLAANSRLMTHVQAPLQ